MPASPIQLPKDPTALANVVNNHFTRERTRMMAQATMFRVVWEYLAGNRNFQIVDLNTGVVRAKALDPEGKLDYQGSDLLRAIDRVAGYLSSYDFTNLVSSDGMGLGSLKEQAISQVLSDAAFSSQDVEQAASQFCYILASIGSCGITAHIDDNPANSIGLSADLEVIHPIELVPFPSLSFDLTKQRGIGREYYMTMDALKERLGTRKVNAAKTDMYWFRSQVGGDPQVDIGGDMVASSIWTAESLTTGGENRTATNSDIDDNTTSWVRLREVWLNGPRGTCTRKVLVSGRAVLQDLNFEGLEAYNPIGFARFMDNGTFYGAGMYHVLYSLSRSIERMVKSLVQEATDRERFGYLLVPGGSLNINQSLREVGKGLKVLHWEPDSFTDNGQRPFVVQPNNTGDTPAKVAALTKQMFDQINPLVDIIKEKGRVESASGLEVLQEEADKALTTPTRGIVHAWGQMYKAGLAKCAQSLVQAPRALPVSRVNVDLAGAVIDWDEGTVRFPQNPLPSVARLRCKPRLSGNRSKAQRKQEALQLLQLQLTTPGKILIQGIEEGWDFAFWQDRERNAVQVGVRQILTLYNDGESPGQMFANPNFAVPDIQLMLLEAFMGGEKMMVASTAVQSEFIKYKQFLMAAQGRVLPDNLPYNPDDIAAAQQGLVAAQGSLPQPIVPGLGQLAQNPR